MIRRAGNLTTVSGRVLCGLSLAGIVARTLEVIIARGALGMLTLMLSAWVEGADACPCADEEVCPHTILAECAGVFCPNSLVVELSSELSAMSSIFSGFHALGPLFRLSGCAFARAVSDTGAALGGKFWSSACRLTCLALAAVAATYSAALACAPRSDISLVRRGCCSRLRCSCYMELAPLAENRKVHLRITQVWSSSRACIA